MGGLGEYPVCHCKVSLSFFGRFVTHTGRTCGLILTFYTSYDVFLCKDVPYGDSVDIPPHLRGQILENCNFWGKNRYFQAKRAKYLNFHIIETTVWIPTKFCTPIKTTKYALWVVQKGGKQIHNGGWPLS